MWQETTANGKKESFYGWLIGWSIRAVEIYMSFILTLSQSSPEEPVAVCLLISIFVAGIFIIAFVIFGVAVFLFGLACRAMYEYSTALCPRRKFLHLQRVEEDAMDEEEWTPLMKDTP